MVDGSMASRSRHAPWGRTAFVPAVRLGTCALTGSATPRRDAALTCDIRVPRTALAGQSAPCMLAKKRSAGKKRDKASRRKAGGNKSVSTSGSAKGDVPQESVKTKAADSVSASSESIPLAKDDGKKKSDVDATEASANPEFSFPYVGPIAPAEDERAEETVTAKTNTTPENAAQFSDLPVPNESRLKLPDGPSAGGLASGPVRRQRRRARKEGNEQDGESKSNEKDDAKSQGRIQTPPSNPTLDAASEQDALDSVRKLTDEFWAGKAGAEDRLVRELEKDPDFVFRGGNATGEYDLAAAALGSGRPNKQGVYVLPYLQSGHILLLAVILVSAFIYYPGFPLTELEDSTRLFLKRGLGLTYAINFALTFVASRESKRRGQPTQFWVAKTALLGGLAVQELCSNAPVKSSSPVGARRAKKKNRSKTKPEDAP